MEWRGIICTLFFILSIGESSSRFQMIWLPNLGAGVDVAGTYFTWPILSASVFVTVAILISMYLIFEHLASYNQPEVGLFICITFSLIKAGTLLIDHNFCYRNRSFLLDLFSWSLSMPWNRYMIDKLTTIFVTSHICSSVS